MDENSQFVEEFLQQHDSYLTRVIKKHLIPNRYSVEDVKQYIAEKMLDILKKREQSDNPILKKTNYFLRCINFYAVEYQREKGYIFALPRRPRKNCEEDEREARSMGFKYLDDITIKESQCLADFSFENSLLEDIPVSAETPVWSMLTGCLSSEEADVIACIYLKNMTWVETSSHLGIAQSTCWSWKNRGLQKLFRRFDALSGDMTANAKRVLRNDEEVIYTFTGLDV